MPDFEMSEPLFNCSTSGQMLRVLVRAFQLAQSDDESQATPLIGNAEGQRSLRRYFEGDNPTEDVRSRAAARIAAALLASGLVPEFRVPAQSGTRPCQEVLSEAIEQWATTWDAVYRQSSTGWPYLPQSLTGFIIGRELVFDLVLRLAAIIHLADLPVHTTEILASHDDACSKMLQNAMDMGGLQDDYKTVARIAQVEERTSQRWLSESIIPDDSSLQKLARGIAKGELHLEADVLRYLRLQVGLMRLVQTIGSVVGPRWNEMLVQGFEQLLQIAIGVNRRLQEDPKRFNSTAEGVDLGQIEFLLKGSTSEVASAVFHLWLEEQKLAIWAYELDLAASKNLRQRLERCYQIIGDWPQFWRNGHEANKVLDFSAEAYQTRCESVALAILCPPLREGIETEPPRYSDIGIPRDLEQEIHRAVALMQEGMPDKAVPLWRKVLTQKPENADYHVYLGIAFRDSGDVQEAREAFHRASELAPSTARPHIEIARCYLWQGLPDLALYHLSQVPSDVRQDSPELLWVQGELQLIEGQFPQALASVNRAIELDSDNADAHDLAARILVRMPQSRKTREVAAEHAKKAAACGRPTGLKEWVDTKRHQRP
jgi:tetratricopeptide (TPR) repeat protein